jgi:hypothetical protein
MIQLANMWDEWWSIEDIGNADIIRPVKHWELTTSSNSDTYHIGQHPQRTHCKSSKHVKTTLWVDMNGVSQISWFEPNIYLGNKITHKPFWVWFISEDPPSTLKYCVLPHNMFTLTFFWGVLGGSRYQ